MRQYISVNYETPKCIFVLFVIGQSTLGRPSLFIPSEALVDSFVDFFCEIEFPPENETVLFQVFK